jgi:ubiquinone/menaquinone biosynthesis C-methylase UbiE
VSDEPELPAEGLVPRFAREHLRAGDPTGWFEPVYAGAGGDFSAVPWVDLTPNPSLVSWLARERPDATGKRAVVVGCGAGDDAEALRDAGFDTIGFDVAPTAIEWARGRFPASADRFVVADLLALPSELVGAFDLVFEAYTLQALPESVRPAAIDGVASLVAPGGTLLIVCTGRDPDGDRGRLPWPLTHAELGRFGEHGLVEQRFEDFVDAETAPRRRFRVEYSRPGEHL